MKTIRITSLVSLLSIALLVTTGCATTGHQGQSKASRHAVRNQSGTLRHPYELPTKAAHFTVTLILQVKEGSFVYTVTDPQGEQVWQGRVNAGQNLDETRTLKPTPGKWVLALNMESVTGSYEVVWKSE